MTALLIAILTILNFLITIYSWVVIIAAIISWVQANPYNPLVRFLYQVTEPVYQFIRRYIPTQIGMVDIAPLLLLFLLQLLELLIGSIIQNLTLYQVGAGHF
jgi:YggT family protein